jgi:hypothetical protein
MFNEQQKFVNEIKEKRNDRHQKLKIEQERHDAIVIIQKNVRGWLTRTKFRRKIL